MRKVWDLDSFVMKSREIHGDIFDYKDSEYQMSLIWEKELPTPDAVNMERTLLENCKSMRYEPKHKFKGWTECFDEVLVGELGI